MRGLLVRPTLGSALTASLSPRKSARAFRAAASPSRRRRRLFREPELLVETSDVFESPNGIVVLGEDRQAERVDVGEPAADEHAEAPCCWRR